MSTHLRDRITELVGEGKPAQARELAREAIRNASSVTVSVEGERVVVETPLFRGEHDVVSDDDGRHIDPHGTYHYTGDAAEFTFDVHVLDDAIEQRANEQLASGAAADADRESSGPASDSAVDPARRAEGGDDGSTGWIDRLLGLLRR